MHTVSKRSELFAIASKGDSREGRTASVPRRAEGRSEGRRVLLAGIALVALVSLLLPVGVQAQSAVTLVKNAAAVVSDTPNANRSTQAFTTGSNELGYTLTSITLHGGNFSDTSDNTVTLHRGTRTGTKVADFTAAASTDGKVLVLTPDDATTLAKETTYVVLTANDLGTTAQWNVTDSDNEDGTPATGWSIGNNSELYRTTTMSWATINSSRLITVTGTVKTANPTVQSIERHNPTTSPTNADSLVWRVTFSESVKNVNPSDFTISGTTANLGVTGSAAAWDVTASGGDLANLDGTVTLGFASDQNIANQSDLALNNTTPSGTNNNTYVLDNTGPVLDEATVAATGDKIEFVFNEALLAAANPGVNIHVANGIKNALKIAVDGRTLPHSGYLVEFINFIGTDMIVPVSNVTPPIEIGQTVIATYTDPTSGDDGPNVLQDTLGNDAKSFTTGQGSVPAVENKSTVDLTGPVLESAAVNAAGTQIDLTFNENLVDRTGKSQAQLNAFLTAITTAMSLQVRGASATFTTAFVTGSNDKLRISPSGGLVIETGHTVVITYTDPTTGNDTQAIEDERGNDAKTFTTGEDGVPAVTNGSTQSFAPTLLTTADGAVIAGDTLTLTFSEALDPNSIPTAPGGLTLTLTRASVQITAPTVTRIVASGSTLTARLSSGVRRTDTVTLAYAPPTTDPLQDTEMRQTLAFSGRSVDNRTTWPTIALSATTLEEGSSDRVTLTLGTGGTIYANPQVFTVVVTGAAKEGEDWSIASKSVTLRAGETEATTTVRAIDDLRLEPDRTVDFKAQLTGMQSAAATLTIEDDDEARIGIEGPGGVRSGSTVTLTLRLLPGDKTRTTQDCIVDFPVTVRLTVTGDTGALAPGVATTSDHTFAATSFDDCTKQLTVDLATREAQQGDTTQRTLNFNAAVVTGGDARIKSADQLDVTVSPAAAVASIERQDPDKSPTNADSLTWRVTFTEDVSNVDRTDFAVSGTTAVVARVQAVSGSATVYDVTVAGGNLRSLNGKVSLRIVSTTNIQDSDSLTLPSTTPLGRNEAYVLDNIRPTVDISGVPAESSRVFWVQFTFSEPVEDFELTDIVVSPGTASDLSESDGENEYRALVKPRGADFVAVYINTGAVQDAAGNTNRRSVIRRSRYTPPPAGIDPNSPCGPRDLSASTERSRTVLLSWNEPACHGRSPITHYEYRYAEGFVVPADTPWTRYRGTLARYGNIKGFDNLVNGRRYVFEVRAVGEGPGSIARVYATPESEPVVSTPSAPRNLSATFSEPYRNPSGGGYVDVTLSWDPSTVEGSISGVYEYRYAEGTSVSTGVSWSVLGQGLQVGFVRLKPATGYVFEVRRRNGSDTSPTARVRATSPAFVPAAPTVSLFVQGTARAAAPLTVGVRRAGKTDNAALVGIEVTDSAFPNKYRYAVVTIPVGAFSATSTFTPAVATGSGRTLSLRISSVSRPHVLGSPTAITGVSVAQAAMLSVADATVREAAGAKLRFVLTLDVALAHDVTVGFRTVDGTAKARDTTGLAADYRARRSTLRIPARSRTGVIEIEVLDDDHDEGDETVSLNVFNPVGAVLTRNWATGTIENADPMPRAWMARFGRSVAEQVLGAVESRIQRGHAPSEGLSLANRRIGLGHVGKGDSSADEAAVNGFGDSMNGETLGLSLDTGDRTHLGDQRLHNMTARDAFLGSSFTLSAGAEGDRVSLWGRATASRFDGREADVLLDGDVTSALLGADWSRGRATTGLIMAHSQGEGGYRREGGGTLSSSLTGLYPWSRYAVNERISVWGVAGYGEGVLTLTPDRQSAMRTDLDLVMGAVGLRGILVQTSVAGGKELAIKTDALEVRTTTAKVQGLNSAATEVTRLRLGLEGSWALHFDSGAVLTPRMEIGVRRDGGDAETGFGTDIGGGLVWSEPKWGLSGEIQGRGLLSHEAEGFREHGLTTRISYDSKPSSPRGPALKLSQTLGGSSSGGMDALFERGSLARLAANDNGAEFVNRRVEMRFGYGLGALTDRFTLTPEMGVGFLNGTLEYTLAIHLVRDARVGNNGSLDLAFEARHSENDVAALSMPAAQNAVGIRLSARY